MPRQYTNLEQCEETIVQLKAKGCTRRKIAEKVGITPEQVHQFLCRYNRNQRNIKAGILPKKKGRPSKIGAIFMTTHWPKISFQFSNLSVSIARKSAPMRRRASS